jgi:TonB-dependent SusC/RagA subfamily outer membrane receptor
MELRKTNDLTYNIFLQMKPKIFLFILLSAICIKNVNSQDSNKKITISGVVMDSEKGPIANAIIMIDNKNTSVKTDAEGNYKIKVKSSAVLIGVFTFGSGTAEDSIKGRTNIDFNFGVVSAKQQINTDDPGEQSINTGYGHVKAKNATTERTTIDGTNKKYASYSSIFDMIQREVSGVQVQGHNIIIQGAQDMFGSVPPLFVVDGTYTDDISSIPPSAVKSIDVLKGTSAAMYGSRGYGGVIVIKTKIKSE